MSDSSRLELFSGYAKINSRKAKFEKRLGVVPVPADLHEYLTADQMESLKYMESFGWALAFVRRSGEKPIAVVRTFDGTQYGILSEDGSIDTHRHLIIR